MKRKKEELELLNSEGPILIAKHAFIEKDTRGFLLEWRQEDQFYRATVDQLKRFLSGESVFLVEEKEIRYSDYPDSMKPSKDEIEAFLNEKHD